MNKALLDTDIDSEILKAIDQNVTRNATAYRQASGRFDFSAVTVMEIIQAFRTAIVPEEILTIDQDGGDLDSRRHDRILTEAGGKSRNGPGRYHQDEGSEVAILFRCECGKEFQTGDEDAGRHARCPVCKRELIVPQPKPLFEDEFATRREAGPRPLSGKALASLILGLCSFVTCFFTGVPAIFLGIFGLNDINDPRKHVQGKGMAVTGIVLGGLSSTLVVPAVLVALLLPAVQAAREAARRAQCVNNLKQIALAMHNYESAYGCFPPVATYGKDGKPLVSWRVLILPYLGQQSRYEQFHLDEPWDSPHNKPLGEHGPNVFKCPSEPISEELTAYEVVVDPHSMFTGEPKGVTVASVVDGTSNTVLVVESTSPVPWTKPEDLSLAGGDLALEMGSKHPGGLNAAMADGSIRFFKNSFNNPISPQLLKGLITRTGWEYPASRSPTVCSTAERPLFRPHISGVRNHGHFMRPKLSLGRRSRTVNQNSLVKSRRSDSNSIDFAQITQYSQNTQRP